ncbi:MAG: glutaredoxin 3 [Rhodospirillaceae bacterium]
MSKKIEIFTSPFCPYCHAAKRLLTSKGVPFEEVDVMMSPAKRDDMMKRTGGARSVPQIFADGEHIGDCDGIHRLDSEGKLDALLGIG